MKIQGLARTGFGQEYLVSIDNAEMAGTVMSSILSEIVYKVGKRYVNDHYEEIVAGLDPKEVSAKVLEVMGDHVGKHVTEWIEEAAHDSRQEKSG